MRIGQLTRRRPHLETVETRCDYCDKDIERHNRGNYDRSEVSMEAKLGENYGDEGDNRDYYWLDCCPQCFLEKVKPAIEALGVKFHQGDDRERYEYQEILPGEREF